MGDLEFRMYNGEACLDGGGGGGIGGVWVGRIILLDRYLEQRYFDSEKGRKHFCLLP